MFLPNQCDGYQRRKEYIFFFKKKEICDKMATLTENTDTSIDPLWTVYYCLDVIKHCCETF